MKINYCSCATSVLSNGKHGGSTLSGSDTYEKALEEGNKDRNYLLSVGYTEVTLDITEACPVCYNNPKGIFFPQKRNKFMGTWKKCPNCKGKCPNTKTVIFEK